MKNYIQLQGKLVLTLILFLYTLLSVSQTTQTFNTAGNYSIVIPAGVTQVTIDAYGGGGGGGSSANTSTNGGSGGGGGAYAKGIHTVIPENTYWYTVGAAGTGGPATSTTAPTAGTNSWFNATSSTNTAPTTNTQGTLAAFGGAGVNNTTSAPTNLGLASSSLGNNTTANGNSGGAGTTSGGGAGGAGASPAAGGGGLGSSSANGGNGTIPGGGGGGGNDAAANKGGDGASGQIAITWTCPTYALTSAATATGPFCGASTSVVTLRSNTLPSGTYTVTYTLAGATAAVGNTATMIFTSGGTGIGTFTTSTLNVGTTNITITNLSSYSACSTAISTNNTASVIVSSVMTAVAGTAINTCSNTGAVNITAGSSATNQTSIAWTSSGTGTFTNASSLTTCTYTPSAADITAGSVTLTLTASNAGCPNVTSTKTLTISSPMTASAGTLINTCATTGAVNITAGSNATNQTLVTWTGGTGTFANANSLTTCTYTPTATENTNGSTITLTLTATNAGCPNVTATKSLVISKVMTAVAGSNFATCSTSSPVSIVTGSSTTNSTSTTWTTSGTGTFSNANSITTCTYTPSPADITAGSVTLTLTASNAGCPNVTATKTLTISSPMTASAGTLINTCATTGAVNITTGSSTTNQTSIAWTSTGTGTFANATSLTTCTYTPTATENTNGSTITLTLTATNAGCPNVTATKSLVISKVMTAVAGSNLVMCSTAGSINIIAGATLPSATNHTLTTWTTSGTGTFSNANSITTCTYTPSPADITAGSVTLTLTASNAGCPNVTATKTLTISSPMTASAGTLINTCATTGAVNITTGSSTTNQTSIAWTSTGTGTFANATSLTTCTYTPTATENTNGSTITLTLTATNAGCPNVTATKSLVISKVMTAVAGSNLVMCSTAGSINIIAGATLPSATNHTLTTWTTSGTGTFSNANSITTCTYTPSPADITAGSVTLTLTASNAGCPNVTATKTLTISSPMTASAGTTINTCATTGAVNITTGSSTTNQTSIAWTSTGTGTFANATSLTTCTYTPAAAENAAGSTITLTLTATNAGCPNVTATKSLVISKVMTAVAGSNLVMCSTAGSINIIAGATLPSATNHTLTTWTTSGTGTFSNANSITTCTYTPSPADITAGSVTLTLTASNAGCPNVTATKTLTISSPMVALAGVNILTCSTTGAVNITNGSGAANQTSIAWTHNGGGTLANATSLTTCTYTPTVAENNAGSTITLTLTATNAGCPNVIATKSLSISKAMTANAGANIIHCSTAGSVEITTGSSATNQTGILWTSSGSGTFSDNTSLISCLYTPSATDITNGSVTLTLTASNTGCANLQSTKTLSIRLPMTASAGTNITTCTSSGAVNITAGSSATNQTGVTWSSSGTGTFTNANSLTSCTYSPSAADNSAGNVTLTLTASNSGCANVISTKTLNIIAPPTAVAGSTILTCATSGDINITSGSSATNQTSILWTSSGTGTFTNANSLTTCSYNPSVADTTSGNVTLTLTATNAGCFTTSTKIIKIYSLPTSVAGTAINTCSTSGAVNITAGSSATNQTDVNWSSSGTGTFSNANSLTTCTYTPSGADITAGSVTLTLSVTNLGCSLVATSTKTLTISYPMTAVAGTPITTCSTSGAVNITTGSSATNQTSIAWTHNGSGTITNTNSLTACTYTPSAAENTAGSTITLTLTTSNAGCTNVTSTKSLSISRTMTAVAGTAINTCSTSGAVNITAGSSATNQTGIVWTSSGTGTFTNNTSLTTCTYTPSATDITAGSVILTLTASNVACPNVTSTKTLTISKPMTAVAGTVINTCATTGAVNITAGSSATNQTTATWTSNGTGTFTNATSLTTCTYTPSAAENTAGSTITLTLTATNAGCANVTSTKSLIISKPMTAVAGTTINTCSTSGAVNITAGSSATNQTLVTWTSNGSGTFTNANSLTTCTYDPSSSDIAAGTIILTLTASNAGCANATATKSLIISKPMITEAGTDIFTCSLAGAVNITAGSSVSNQTGQTWTSSGTGTFANATSLTTCTYTPSAADITAGFVTLTLTTTNASCASESSNKTLVIYTSPVITATTPATRTGIGTVILGASTTAGTLYWYSSLTGGTLLGFGTSFQTPSISATTTYYVEAVNGVICTSTPRVAVVATVLYSEIDVTGNAVAIVDGDTTPSTTDFTDFGSTNLTRTFTISNTGLGILNISSISFTGTNASDFSVTTVPNDDIASNNSTTFTVTFSPSAAGIRTATLIIANNDITENPYDFKIQGTGVAQELNILGNSVSIVDGDITPTTADWTDYGSTVDTRIFTLQNLGNIPITLGAITFSGTNPTDFTVTSAPSSTIPAYSSTTMEVTFTPGAINSRTATINIVNNDSDENPYNFALSGFGIIPEINLQGNAISIVSGDTTPSTTDWTDFSNNIVTRTFTILNEGNRILTIGSISISGSDFTVTTPPSSSIGAFDSSTFVVTFNPTSTGLRSATITIANNDTTGGENPYTFKIQGTGVAQEIDIQGNATSIADGDTTPSTTDGTDFSNVDLYRTFTIFNSGNITMTVGAITFSGTNPTDFTISTAPSSTVAAFSSTTFVVRFNTAAVSGTRSATISIVNNDSNENPYDFKIQGTAGVPEINITSQYGVTIADNDTTPSQSDQTDFGQISIEDGSITVNYIIQNTGTAAMSVGAATFSGTNASDFSMVMTPSAVIAAGGTSRFQIRFATTVKGTRTASFSIVNNDSNENPYNFDLTGFGIQTYFDNDGDGTTDNKDIDDDNDGINDVKEQTDALAYPLTSLVKYTFLNETFGTGTTKGEININTPNATCTYCYEDGYGSACDAAKTLEDGEYCVTYKITGELASDPENIHANLDWYIGLDHTPDDTNGRMAVFNASFPAGTFYETRIDGIIPNVPISYSFWVLNIMNQTLYPGSIQPNITVEFIDLDNNFISSYNTGFITRCSSSNPSDNTCATANWLQFSTTANLGDLTSCIVRFKNNSTGGRGNDLAIDDINISQNYVDTDNDGIANIYDLDDENDGIPDVEEAGFKSRSNGLSKMDLSSSATWIDANGNGQNDNVDTLISSNTLSIPDTDGDGIPNYLDLDSDNDSIYDVDEGGIFNGDGDINGDGRGDLLDVDKDGILDLYDNNNTVFGTSVRAYAQDTDNNGVPDYLQLDSNNDGIKDIQTGLYSSLDANNDGKVDGSSDLDKDGLLDTFDTSDQVTGSPRDLNRKLQLEFDGRNDYGQGTGLLGGLAGATLMAWIDLNSAYSTYGVIIGQTNFNIRITPAKRLEAYVNGTLSTYTTPLNTSQWTHVGAVYGGGLLKLYINGVMVKSISLSGNINADTSMLTIGKDPASNTNYFKGKIDELRVFNTALTDDQFQRMVYQEIQNTSSQVRGAIIPKDVGSLAFSKVARYYKMDAYKDNIIDDLTTLSTDNSAGMKIYNNKNIYVQQAPVPFVTERTGNFATALNSTINDIRGQDATDYDYSIIRVKHNITETSNSVDLGMIVDSGVNIVMNNDTKLQNDWYLKLDGKIGLEGKSQLVQTTNSELDVTSAGTIKRDQQGQSNLYNYNYWCSPTSIVNTLVNNKDYTIDDVLNDGTNPTNPVKINWVSSLNGAATNPISISNRWLYKFDNYSNTYANWVKITQNSPLRVGQGFTMKGSGSTTGTQNLTFVGKPNNGTITTNSVSSDQLLLTGNPYPSALNANQFIADNLNSTDGTIYFWEHYSSNNTHVLSKYQGGYATRNLTGGIMATSSNVDFISKLGTPSKGIPNQYIPVGQGFFVNGKIGSGGTITFNNGQRGFQKEDASSTSNNLFKTTASTKKTAGIELGNNANDPVEEENFKKIRLGFNSNNLYHKQVLLGFMDEKATSEMDYGYDALSIDDFPNDMYFLNGENQLVIQGEGFFDTNASYPIGVKTDIEGKVSFALDDIENFDTNQPIYIYDKLTDTYHDIRNEKYEVSVPVGTTNTRFSLRFKNNTLGIPDQDNDISEIQIKYVQNGNMLVINNNLLDVTAEKVTIYNILGQNITSMKVENQDQKNIQLPVKSVSAGVYIAKIKTSKGNMSKKFIVN